MRCRVQPPSQRYTPWSDGIPVSDAARSQLLSGYHLSCHSSGAGARRGARPGGPHKPRLRQPRNPHAGQNEWSAAAVNNPLATGTSLWTDPDARAEIRIGPNTIAMASSTELDVGRLTAAVTQINLPQGRLYLHVRQLDDIHTFEIAIPHDDLASGRVGDTRHARGVASAGSLCRHPPILKDRYCRTSGLRKRSEFES
jgi:hypothetical protein